MILTHRAHPSWQPILQKALNDLEPNYINQLLKDPKWLPGLSNVLNAFSMPLGATQFILWGESPYPRAQSANGYAFWDNAVSNIWSLNGLSKQVNRATSLRNLIKMLLVARGDLRLDDNSQGAIAAISKDPLVKTLPELFNNLMDKGGFLLLNASLVLSERPVKKEANHWRPFMQTLLTELSIVKPTIELILLGQVAKVIGQLATPLGFTQFVAEHPYNISFIKNQAVLDFFRPLDLLAKCSFK